MIDLSKYQWYIVGFLFIYVSLNYIRIRYNKQKINNKEGFQNIGNNIGYGGKSVNPINNQTVQFDTNYYLRNDDQSVLVKRTQNIVPFRCNTYQKPNITLNDNKDIDVSIPITYLDKITEYFKRKVYPLQNYETYSTINTIENLINNNLDIGFINEEILLRYYSKDCKYLTQYLNNNYRNEQQKADNRPYEYLSLNFGVIATTFYQDMYLFVPINSKIMFFWDFATINEQKIGVYRDSYYYFKISKCLHN